MQQYQQYNVSKASRIKAAILFVTIAVIAVYAAQKAWGLWHTPGRDFDLTLFGLDMDNIVPAILLSVVAIAAIPAIWYIVVELVTTVKMDEAGILLKAPGYRIYYRWDEIKDFHVISGPVEDAATTLQVETLTTDDLENQKYNLQTEDELSLQTEIDPVEPFLSEADLRENKKVRQRNKIVREAQLALIKRRAVSNDGSQLKWWVRLLYPQALRPDRLLLYPALDNRTALLAQIERFLGRN